MKNRICALWLFSIAIFGSAVAQNNYSIDSLKGFLCYKFGDSISRYPSYKPIREDGPFRIYLGDSVTLCGVANGQVELEFYNERLYQIFIDFPGQKECMSLLNIFTHTFGKTTDVAMISTELEIRAYLWSGKNVGIKYETDASYSGAKIFIYDKTEKDRIYNLFYKEGLNNSEEKLLKRMFEK